MISLGYRPSVGDRAWHVDPRHVGTVERIESEQVVLRYDNGWIGVYAASRVNVVGYPTKGETT